MTTSLLTSLRFACLVCLVGSSAASAAWMVQDTHLTGASLRAVQAVNDKVVWVGAPGGAWRTLDGGRTWESRPIAGTEALDFRGIAVLGRQTVLLLSAGPAEEGRGRIYRTADGGKTWQLVFESREKGVFLDGLSFWDERNGLAFGDPVAGKWYLLRTHDGGRTWGRIAPEKLPAMLPGESAFAASNSSLILQGSSGAVICAGGATRARVFLSADRGEHWDVVDTPMAAGPTAGIFGLRFWDARHGVAVGGDSERERAASDNVMLTSDGGRTWQLTAPTMPPGVKESVIRLTDGTLIAVGPAGTGLSRDSGRSWIPIDTLDFHAASCAKDQCWSVGAHGMVAKWQRRGPEVASFNW
jgi:photosystem II stability/assembly factor-like uncharacterized protein